MHTGVYKSHASKAMTCGNDAMNMKAHLCSKKAGDEIDVDRGTPITVARQCANSKVSAVLGESTAEPGPSEPETRTKA